MFPTPPVFFQRQRFASGFGRLLAACLCLFATSPGQAQGGATAPATSWRLEAGAGVEYDSNVSVDEVDLSSGQSDYAITADFKISARHRFDSATVGTLTYDVGRSDYSEFSRVDRLTHIVGADVSTDLGKSSAGLSIYYIDSRLDEEAFLNFLRVSPSMSGFLSQRWFARGAYVYSERDIDARPLRDASTHSAEADLYYFHRGLRSYANVGYRFRDENAVADELDFLAHSLKFRYIRRFDLWKRKAKTEFALRYEVRDYRSEEPTISERRKDDRLRLKLDFEIPINDRFTWQAYYSYGDYESNLPRADFIQTIVGTRLQYTW
ncbi:MAG: surface lipoprotein assembly modifier [Pseudomonadota bacterium]